MQRYFVENNFDAQDELIISGENAKHISKVMRMQQGDKVIIVTHEVAYISEIVQLDESVTVRNTREVVPSPEMPLRVDIACGLPKGDKLEWIAQKGTELGMHALIPFVAQRSIVKWDEKKGEKKTERWQKIVQEAAEQSHRTIVPAVHQPKSFKQLLAMLYNYDAVFLADEEDAKQLERISFASKLRELKSKDCPRILCIFGPEGGIARQEAESLLAAGAKTMSLGPRILRAETAPLYALAAISYEFE